MALGIFHTCSCRLEALEELEASVGLYGDGEAAAGCCYDHHVSSDYDDDEHFLSSNLSRTPGRRPNQRSGGSKRGSRQAAR
jgi:hypothetical protein